MQRSSLRYLTLCALCACGLAGWALEPVKYQVINTIKPERIMVRPPVLTPTTGPAAMNRPGPVVSPDPYFTLRIGEHEVYRDALDQTLAYYRPVFRLGKRVGTPLAAGVGELATQLDGFRFRYYRFESGGNPKWADMQVVVTADKPAEVTLEAVQRSWRNVTRLIVLPYRLDLAAGGVAMRLPYPERRVRFAQLLAQGGAPETRWYLYSTNTAPTPPLLLTDADNDVLNETKTRDFASLLTSDLADMPSFQPTLELRVTYAGWSGATPISKLIESGLLTTPIRIMPMTPGTADPARPAKPLIIPAGKSLTGDEVKVKPVLIIPAPVAIQPVAPPVKTTPAVTSRVAVLRPDLLRVIGELKPRQDVNYTYADAREMRVSLPISYPKAKTPNYDYYFLSDSGRFGGPYFEPSTLPNRPVRVEPPTGFSGYWYESHSFGKRLVWPAPRELRLRWAMESGLRPSCRFSLTGGTGGALTAHLTYDLYPDFSLRELAAITDEMRRQTGEQIDLLPFTDLLDANQIALAAGTPSLSALVAAKQVTVTRLTPRALDDPWLRVNVEMPVEDWAALSLFMRLGDLGTWRAGVLTGASSGVAESVEFALRGDLLQTAGGPVVATHKAYDPATGGYQVTLDNYGMAPLAIHGVRVQLTGTESTTLDLWYDGRAVELPGVGSASSFDQRDGASGSIVATINEPAAPALKALMDTGKYTSITVGLTPEMIGPSTAPEAVGGIDPDIAFSFLRSLCYQYIGSSEVIQVPVAPLEAGQWADYASGRVVIRFQGFVYARDLDLSGANRVDMRRIPREGAYAAVGKPGDADLLEYRATFVKRDGTVLHLPAQTGETSTWVTGDISGINLDMTQAR